MFGFTSVFSWIRRCWKDNISYEGGLALIWMDGLLLVPFVMAAFFYPFEALIAAGVVVLLSFAVYESCVIWRRHHPVSAIQPPEDPAMARGPEQA